MLFMGLCLLQPCLSLSIMTTFSPFRPTLRDRKNAWLDARKETDSVPLICIKSKEKGCPDMPPWYSLSSSLAQTER